MTFPVLKPIFLILTSLSIIWDFQVFTQPFLLPNSRPEPGLLPDEHLRSTRSRSGSSEYGLGSAIALVMVVIMLIRHLLLRPADGADRERCDERRRGSAAASPPAASASAWRALAGTLAGLVVFVVMVFPVYWMVTTAFKPGTDINSYTPKWIPTNATLVNFTDAIHTRVLLVVGEEQPDRRRRHRRALARARVPRSGRAREVPLHRAQGVHRADDRDPDAARRTR